MILVLNTTDNFEFIPAFLDLIFGYIMYYYITSSPKIINRTNYTVWKVVPQVWCHFETDQSHGCK